MVGYKNVLYLAKVNSGQQYIRMWKHIYKQPILLIIAPNN